MAAHGEELHDCCRCGYAAGLRGTAQAAAELLEIYTPGRERL
jgi:hypothetical protein